MDTNNASRINWGLIFAYNYITKCECRRVYSSIRNYLFITKQYLLFINRVIYIMSFQNNKLHLAAHQK